MTIFNRLRLIFKKTSRLDNKQIIGSIFSNILNEDDSTILPQYCPFIKSETDAKKYSLLLPLIYIWNENPVNGSFTVSVNGYKVDHFQERFCTKDDPNYISIKTEVMLILLNSAKRGAKSISEETGDLPSILYEWLEI